VSTRQIVSQSKEKATFSETAGADLLLGFLSVNVMNENRLFAGNLSFQTGENDLQNYFAQAGAITSVNLMLDKVTGKSRGFVFVEFATTGEARKAIELFHNKDFQGRAMTVNAARPREECPPRWSGNRGNRGERRVQPWSSPFDFSGPVWRFSPIRFFPLNKSLTDCEGDLS
jgi:cold-inducible RNA-binding protein